jgi:hypothetical protein
VVEAERFGDEELQQKVREIFLWSARKDPSGLVGYLEGARIGMPHRFAASTAGPFIALDARSRGATDDNVRRAIDGRPAGRLATRIVPHFPGRTPAVLPPEWLAPISAPAG